MLQTPQTFNPNVPFTNPAAAYSAAGYPNAGQTSAAPMPQTQPTQMDQIMGNPQTQSFAGGGKARKRTSMIEVYMSPDEIAQMVEAQGGADHDRHTGRHVFKKLSRFMENPHVERAIRNKFAAGGMPQQGGQAGGPGGGMGGIMNVIDQARNLGMPRPGFASGGSTGYTMPDRSPPSAENYARGGDTQLVYITPHMKRLFDDLGKGSVNPVTGKSEYFGLSDIWSGIKSVGGSALGALNAAAPQLANMARPLIDKLPVQYQGFANKALDMAPGLINSVNSYVNPQSAAPSNQTPQDQQQNQAGFSEMPFGGDEGMQELPQQQQQQPSFAQHMGNYAGQAAGQMGGPMGRAAQAGIRSYMGGKDPRQIGANMFGAGTSQMRNPMMDVARGGVQQFGQGASPMQTLQHMGSQAYNQFMGQPRGNNNNDRRAMESQYLDQIYKNPQNAYA